jgi:hypothetical protein
VLLRTIITNSDHCNSRIAKPSGMTCSRSDQSSKPHAVRMAGLCTLRIDAQSLRLERGSNLHSAPIGRNWCKAKPGIPCLNGNGSGDQASLIRCGEDPRQPIPLGSQAGVLLSCGIDAFTSTELIFNGLLICTYSPQTGRISTVL